MTDRPPRARTPFRLNLEQQKKRARNLDRAVKAGDPAALARFRARHPKAADREGGRGSLSDAQLVVARELGLPSWPRLKAHIAEMERMRAALADGAAPDAGMPTLHVRCGSDIARTLREAGFQGDFLEVSDPVCQGPVTDAPDALARRAHFVTDAYGAAGGFSLAKALDKLAREAGGLAEAAARYARVVLWMEHDSYDQLVLARCLAAFAAGPPAVLELVSADHFPGAARFIGLGQLPPEALRLLWDARRPLGAAQLGLGPRTWEALTSPDPKGLAAIARSGTPGLTSPAPALRRHLRELPDRRDGLSLTERLVLEILAEESRTIGEAFALLMKEREPLPWLGDLMFLFIVENMARTAPAGIEVLPESRGEPWPRRRLAVTEAGRAVLAGERDWLSLGPPERWVGGVRIRAGQPCWRWDGERQEPVMVRGRPGVAADFGGPPETRRAEPRFPPTDLSERDDEAGKR